MKPQEFVTRLRECVPSVEALKADGLSEAEANEIRAGFMATKKTEGSESDSTAGLDALLTRFDVSKIEIGTVRFGAKARRHPAGTQFGVVEADPLVRLESGEIAVAELHAPEHILWKCSSGDEALLDALIEVACFYGRVAENAQDDEDATRERVAEKATELAGGERYREFYVMLLGVR